VIIKLQVPLSSNLPLSERKALLYNESRDYEVAVPISDEMTRLLRGRPKAFFEISMVYEGYGFRFEYEVTDPGW
jgi:hypothetical protein